MKPNLLYYLILFVAGFLLQSLTNAQDMYVKADSYVYVSDQFVYIKNDLELNASTSNFYLRKDGQLLQGTTGAGANKGVGSLSVFQEGTVNNFQYNYWCSPVGSNSLATSINNNFGIGLLGTPTTLTTTTAATISSPFNYDGTASPLSISPYWIYKFINKSLYSDWVAVGANCTIAPGEGFTMKGSSGTDTTTINGVQNNPDGKHQRYDFRGKPNDGNITISVLPEELTLTGNPYPSAIDLSAFLIAETNCTGIAYFWEQDKNTNSHNIADYKGGYGTYSPGTDIYTPALFYSYSGTGSENTMVTSLGIVYKRKFAPIGQGFMIEGKIGATGNVTMKNSYRTFVKEGTANNSQFEKKTNTKLNSTNDVTPQIRFNTLLNNNAVSQMVLAFDPLATDGIDHAKDAGSPNDGPANNYFVINDNEYVINVLPFDIDKKIPIGFRNLAEANYKITVQEMINITEVSDVYLHDKTTDLYFDIKNSFYELTLPAGIYNNRFEIVFKNNTLERTESEKQIITIQQDNKNKNLVIHNPQQTELASCSIYDVVGKLIFKEKQLGSNSTFKFPTAELPNGIYIVKLSNNNKSDIAMKIIVKN